MSRLTLTPEEFNPYYAQYIDRVAPDRSLHDALVYSREEVFRFFKSLNKEKLNYRYDVGKWTPKEVLQHLMDTERVFIYRALRFARKDTNPLVGFEQDDFIAHSNANERALESLLNEYDAVRQATIAFFEGVDTAACHFIGTASGSPLSARAAGYITAGHDLHHIQIIRDRYL